LTDFRNF